MTTFILLAEEVSASTKKKQSLNSAQKETSLIKGLSRPKIDKIQPKEVNCNTFVYEGDIDISQLKSMSYDGISLAELLRGVDMFKILKKHDLTAKNR